MSPITSWTAINWDFIKMGKAKRACFKYVYINDTQAHTQNRCTHTYIYSVNKETSKENNPSWQIKIHFLFSSAKQIYISICST